MRAFHCVLVIENDRILLHSKIVTSNRDIFAEKVRNIYIYISKFLPVQTNVIIIIITIVVVVVVGVAETPEESIDRTSNCRTV